MDATPADWPDQIDLEPTAAPVAMGTRALGARPWLISDDDAPAQLELKRRLHETRRNDVLVVDDDSRSAGQAVLDLLRAHGVEIHLDTADAHPLERAGLSVQEDLCLMGRRSDGWYLEAGSVCFPSRWRLRDKVGRHVTAVHAPVSEYPERLADRVDHLFDRLGERPVWRRNWFVHPDPELFQPERPPQGDPLIPAADVPGGLMVRSERQTLRRLPLDEPWILFTIRIQQTTLGAFVGDPVRRSALREYLERAPESTTTHRGLRPEQVTEVLGAFEASSL